MPAQARLRVYGHGDVEADLVISYLMDLKRAYDAILVFETLISDIQRDARDLSFPLYYTARFGWIELSRRAAPFNLDWPPSSEQIESFIPPQDQLVLSAARISSPGFWEFLGKLNVFEVLRQYLNDRHERRKDRQYREPAEQRRLSLENMMRENKVIADRLKIAKELGATERDLAPLLNELLRKPLSELDRHQDRGVIDNAIIVNPEDRVRHQ